MDKDLKGRRRAGYWNGNLLLHPSPIEKVLSRSNLLHFENNSEQFKEKTNQTKPLINHSLIYI